jgi:hypothetical protein
MISGWIDGGVRRYHLDDVRIDSNETISINKIIQHDYPRNVIFFDSLILITPMNRGKLQIIRESI